MSDGIFNVMTPFHDVAALGQGYMNRADGERLWVPLPVRTQAGQEVRFVIHLLDGTPAFAGSGRCIQMADQGPEVDPSIRFEALLDSLAFDERSQPVYDYIVAVRVAALEMEAMGEMSEADYDAQQLVPQRESGQSQATAYGYGVQDPEPHELQDYQPHSPANEQAWHEPPLAEEVLHPPEPWNDPVEPGPTTADMEPEAQLRLTQEDGGAMPSDPAEPMMMVEERPTWTDSTPAHGQEQPAPETPAELTSFEMAPSPEPETAEPYEVHADSYEVHADSYEVHADSYEPVDAQAEPYAVAPPAAAEPLEASPYDDASEEVQAEVLIAPSQADASATLLEAAPTSPSPLDANPGYPFAEEPATVETGAPDANVMSLAIPAEVAAAAGALSPTGRPADQAEEMVMTPSIMPIATGILTRPAIALHFQPVRARGPARSAATGFFVYEAGSLPKPNRPPHPSLDRAPLSGMTVPAR